MTHVSVFWLVVALLYLARWWIVGGLGAGAIIFAVLHFGG